MSLLIRCASYHFRKRTTNTKRFTSLHEQVEEEGIDEEEEVSEKLCGNFRVYVEVFDEIQRLCENLQHAGNFVRDLHLAIL